MNYKLTLALGSILLFFNACYYAGEEIGELPLSTEKITSLENVYLEKGDEITIFTKTKVKTIEPREEKEEESQPEEGTDEYYKQQYYQEQEEKKREEELTTEPTVVKYHVEKENKTLEIETYFPESETKFINSSKIRDYKEIHTYKSYSEDEEEPEKEYYTIWEYEAESAVISIKEDGKYTFDFKLYSPDKNDVFADKQYSLIIRQR